MKRVNSFMIVLAVFFIFASGSIIPVFTIIFLVSFIM